MVCLNPIFGLEQISTQIDSVQIGSESQQKGASFIECNEEAISGFLDLDIEHKKCGQTGS